LGFNESNEIILFNFEQSICVRSRTTNTEVYQMSGSTGTFKYMAPEVALDQPYTEKVDVYSFSLVVWEMITDETAYDSIKSRLVQIQKVAIDGVRPSIYSSWPIGFKTLLQDSWHIDQFSRPSFETIIQRLDTLIEAEPEVLIDDNHVHPVRRFFCF